MDSLFTWSMFLVLGILLQLSTFHNVNGAYKDDAVQSQTDKQTVVEEKYEVTSASFYHGRQKRDTTLNKGRHLDDVTLVFKTHQRNFILDLSLNKHLFSKAYIEKTVKHSGNHVYKPENHISNHCFYHGGLRDIPDSMAALSTCGGISGFVTVGRETYHVEPEDKAVPGSIRVYKEIVQGSEPGAHSQCESDDKQSVFFVNGTVNNLHRKEFSERVRRSIRGPYDGNENARFVELFIVNDHRTFERQGRNEQTLIRRSQDIANIVSRLYRPLNIYIALVGVEIWSDSDQVEISPYANSSLEKFLLYRKQRINPYHQNDNAQLITGQTFNDGVVGKAIKSSICTHQYSGGVDMDRTRITHVATTVAHELGHNFGMDHDNYSVCRCKQEKCIMAPTSGGSPSPSQWSTCSRVAVIEAFDLGMDYCLKNMPENLYEGPVCGNTFVEEGEECDCGLTEDCTSKCCNATTCRLKPGAECATGSCCNQDTCKPKPAATLCRAAMEECDLAEFCNGESEYCPSDVYLQNGLPCKDKRSYCYQGHCKTHTDQCRMLWGSTGRVSDPICFQHLNTNGSKHGNCGYDWKREQYIRCDKDDVMCGLLHCVHLNEKLMFWRESLAKATPATFLTKGRERYVCRSVILDVGLDMPDPGMAPDGAKCGDKKICLSNKCTPLSRLRISPCPNCHGNGVCNSMGQCHCNEGFGPPYCNGPGHGGSTHSGPMKTLEDNSLLIGMLVFFAVFVIHCLLCLFAYYHREKLTKWWNQRASALKYSVPSLPTIKLASRNKRQPPPPPRPGTGGGGGTREPKQTSAMMRNGNVSVEISSPVLQDSTPNQSQSSSHTLKIGKKPQPLPTRQVHAPNTQEPTQSDKPKSSFSKMINRSADSSFQSFSKLLNRSKDKPPPAEPSPKPPLKNVTSNPMFQPTDPIVKKDSFNRDREISKPVLISTTDRRSKAFVIDHGSDNLEEDHGFSFADSSISPPPPPAPRQAAPRRNRAGRAPPRPTSLPPQPLKEKLRKEEEKHLARKSVVDPGAKSPPRPPPPNVTNQSQPFSQQQEMQIQPVNFGNQSRRLNLNPNLHSSRNASSFDEPNPAPTPRVFTDKSRFKNDSKPNGQSSSSKTNSVTVKKPEKHSAAETKANGRVPLSTNATKTSFDLKGKNVSSSNNNNNNLSADTRSNWRSDVTSHKNNIPEPATRGSRHIPDNRSGKKSHDTKPRQTGEVSKPRQTGEVSKQRQTGEVSKARKPLPKTPTQFQNRIRETDIIDDNANPDEGSGCVAEIKAMFDDMDIGRSLSDSPEKESTPSPPVLSKVNRNNSGLTDRPKPPPKPGQGSAKVKPGQGLAKVKPGSKVRSVNV
ncbi:LOW QUALITY PROTEIN: disintegrin and metalloproteinase domain-containing protein 12-like [Pecten maximus]|uniref:LOW QUALITY PROTEIN: disintegrin and metalloproteinase domain-containing protein 12-like n=1 Tax=Pecten maximus TaxID=6579 RepID=UPI0014582C82|nr:LOW QUALITY PROTEIN: disintegrin and metalloproteinase domain-containing protein 12-like [Pecten maximus]